MQDNHEPKRKVIHMTDYTRYDAELFEALRSMIVFHQSKGDKKGLRRMLRIYFRMAWSNVKTARAKHVLAKAIDYRLETDEMLRAYHEDVVVESFREDVEGTL
jgi:spore maturation protein CgeB